MGVAPKGLGFGVQGSGFRVDTIQQEPIERDINTDSQLCEVRFSNQEPVSLVAEFIRPKKCTPLFLERVILSQKV